MLLETGPAQLSFVWVTQTGGRSGCECMNELDCFANYASNYSVWLNVLGRLVGCLGRGGFSMGL